MGSAESHCDYYVYTHRRNDTGDRFYIGMGRQCRAWRTGSRSNHWKAIASKFGYEVEILASGLSKCQAYSKEKLLIAFHGRRDNGTGILVNHTVGGEGSNGMSDAGRKSLSDKMKARHLMPDFAERRDARIAAVNISPALIAKRDERSRQLREDPAFIEARAKRSSQVMLKLNRDAEFVTSRNDRLKFYRSDPETIAKWTKTLIERVGTPVKCEQVGLIFPSLSSAVLWLKKQGHSKARDSAICMACRGKLKSAYGYTWGYA
jgi:hypothetical protein